MFCPDNANISSRSAHKRLGTGGWRQKMWCQVLVSQRTNSRTKSLPVFRALKFESVQKVRVQTVHNMSRQKKYIYIGRKCARVVHLTALKVLVFCDSAEKTLKLVSGAKHTLCYSLLSCYALTSHISYARCYMTMKTAMACGAIG